MRSGPSVLNRCPECQSPFAIEGREIISLRPDDDTAYYEGRMVVCANCGKAYMSLLGGVAVPQQSFGFTQKPDRSAHVAEAPPREHTPTSGEPSPGDPLKWRRRA